MAKTESIWRYSRRILKTQNSRNLPKNKRKLLPNFTKDILLQTFEEILRIMSSESISPVVIKSEEPKEFTKDDLDQAISGPSGRYPKRKRNVGFPVVDGDFDFYYDDLEDELGFEEKLPPKRPKPPTQVVLNYEEYVINNDPASFWLQRKVKSKLNLLRVRIESVEKSACNDFFDEYPPGLFNAAKSLNVSPEMICAYIGDGVLLERRLQKGIFHSELLVNGNLHTKRIYLSYRKTSNCTKRSGNSSKSNLSSLHGKRLRIS